MNRSDMTAEERMVRLETEVKVYREQQRDWNEHCEAQIRDHALRLQQLERKIFAATGVAATLGSSLGVAIMSLVLGAI